MEPIAIPTYFNGRHYRSRTEARWATFLDYLGIPQDYEKEGFELPSGRYLPDFWLPEQKCWIEIKGEQPNQNEIHRARELASHTAFPFFLFSGTIRVSHPHGIGSVPSALAFLPVAGGAVTDDDEYQWCECPECDLLGIAYQGRSDRLPCKECLACALFVMDSRQPKCLRHASVAPGCPRHARDLDRTENKQSIRLMKAYDRAMCARFEPGQSGGM